MRIYSFDMLNICAICLKYSQTIVPQRNLRAIITSSNDWLFGKNKLKYNNTIPDKAVVS